MLAVENLKMAYGDVRAPDEVSLEVTRDAIVAMVGAPCLGAEAL